MTDIVLIMPGNPSNTLCSMADATLGNTDVTVLCDYDNIPDLRNKKILFAVELDGAGLNIPMLSIISKLYKRGSNALSGSTASIIIRSCTELYTKSVSQDIIYLANNLGCRFPGHPAVEATVNLENFRTWQKQLNMSLEDICLELCNRLGKRLLNDNLDKVSKPNILALHSSFRKTSNTLELWHMISRHLSTCSITELHVENGEVLDCKGCSFKTCTHYSMQNSCFYGGVMVKNILPAIEKADAVVWICPNYNDAVSANLTAVINRLTALYRKTGFYNKTVFSVIVSGSSGSDSVAKQLIGALNINKGFRLPPYSSISEIANDTGEILKVPGINLRAEQFAGNMMEEIKV